MQRLAPGPFCQQHEGCHSRRWIVGSRWSNFSHTLPVEQPQNACQSRCSSFIFLQTRMMCPVLESMRVTAGSQLQVTVLAFSCLVTTQCSIVSAEAGGK